MTNKELADIILGLHKRIEEFTIDLSITRDCAESTRVACLRLEKKIEDAEYMREIRSHHDTEPAPNGV